MPFNRTWDETDPDGDIVRVSGLDDSIRAAKAAVRERLEGDGADPYSGIFESGSFANTAIVRKGTGRIHVDTEANIPALPKKDGAMAISSDKNRLYHLKESGIIEVGYLNLDGSRAMTNDLKMGNKKITGLAKATAAGEAVEFSQAALIDQQRTITNLWTFNRGTGAPFAVPSGAAKVANLDADKLDGLDASAFLLASALPPAQSVAKIAFNAAAFGTSYTTIDDLTVTLNQTGAWVFRYFVRLTITGGFNARITGGSLVTMLWVKDATSGGGGSSLTSSDSGVLQITATVSGSVGNNILFQVQGTTNSGTVAQSSSLLAVKV